MCAIVNEPTGSLVFLGAIEDLQLKKAHTTGRPAEGHDQGSWQGYKGGAFTGEKACLRPLEAPPARCVHEVEEDFHSEGGGRGEGRRLKK